MRPPPSTATLRGMVRVSFPQVLQRHVACPPVDVEARGVREALEAASAVYPRVRGYLFDDGGALGFQRCRAGCNWHWWKP